MGRVRDLIGVRALALGLAGALLAAQPAAAVEWFTEADGGTITTSAFEAGRSVAIRCEAGELTLAVGVRETDVAAPLRDADPVYVVTTTDPAADGSTPSFTARATPDRTGSNWSFALSAKDSGSRIGALAGGGSEIEFALTTEPGGERLNIFRLRTAGAAEALSEVLTACATGEAPPAEAAAPPPVEAPPADTAAQAPVRALPPIGPGELADNAWHLVTDPDRTYLYRRDADDNSLTFECLNGSVSVTLGLALTAIDPKLAVEKRANLALDPAIPGGPEIISRVERDGVGYYRSRGARAATYVSMLAAQGTGATVALGAPKFDYLPVDQLRNAYPFDAGSISGDLQAVLAACDVAPAAVAPVAETAPPAPAATPAETPAATDIRPEWYARQWRYEAQAGPAAVASAEGKVTAFFSCEVGVYGFSLRISKDAIDPRLADGGKAELWLAVDNNLSFVLEPRELAVAFEFSLTPQYAEAVFDAVRDADAGSAVMSIFDGGKSQIATKLYINRSNGMEEAMDKVRAACGDDTAPITDEPASEANEWVAPNWEGGGDAEYRYVTAGHSEGGALVASVDAECIGGAPGLSVYVAMSLYDAAAFGGGRARIYIGLDGHGVSYEANAIEGRRLAGFHVGGLDSLTAFDKLRESTASELTFDVLSVDTGKRVYRITTGTAGLGEMLSALRAACVSDAPPMPPPEDEYQQPVFEEGVWTVYRDALDRLTAQVHFEGAELAFACVGADVGFRFGVPKLDATIAREGEFEVTFSVDPGAKPMIGVATVQPFDLAGLQFVGFRGPAAEHWATMARDANRVVQLGLTIDGGRIYNVTNFPAKGSTAAIKQLLAECG